MNVILFDLKNRNAKYVTKKGILKDFATCIFVQKVNQLIDYKTRLVDQLDRKNIELNKAVGLYGEKPCDTPSQTTVRFSSSPKAGQA